MLTFAKLEASKLSLENRWFDLRECVESAVAVIRGSLSNSPVEVIVEIPCSLPWSVVGDETRVSQVLIKCACASDCILLLVTLRSSNRFLSRAWVQRLPGTLPLPLIA